MKKTAIACLVSVFFLATASNAEIVTNSKGDRIELKPDGTWTLIPLQDSDFVNDGSTFSIEVPDANKQEQTIRVTPDVSLLGKGNRLQKKEFQFQVRMASIFAQYKLKNPYSYVPRSVTVKQRGNNVSITIGFTGKNSYGGEVTSYYTKEYYLEDNGKLKDVTINP